MTVGGDEFVTHGHDKASWKNRRSRIGLPPDNPHPAPKKLSDSNRYQKLRVGSGLRQK
jgi:hypothetical protein